MAFTEVQKVTIRHVLGYPDVYRGSNLRLESAINVIGTRAESQAKVEDILSQIAAIENELSPSNEDGVWTQDGVKKADEVEMFGSEASGNVAEVQMRARGRMWVGRLSIFIGVPKAHDIFSTEGYHDDSWAGSANQVGRPFPLG